MANDIWWPLSCTNVILERMCVKSRSQGRSHVLYMPKMTPKFEEVTWETFQYWYIVKSCVYFICVFLFLFCRAMMTRVEIAVVTVALSSHLLVWLVQAVWRKGTVSRHSVFVLRRCQTSVMRRSGNWLLVINKHHVFVLTKYLSSVWCSQDTHCSVSVTWGVYWCYGLVKFRPTWLLITRVQRILCALLWYSRLTSTDIRYRYQSISHYP